MKEKRSIQFLIAYYTAIVGMAVTVGTGAWYVWRAFEAAREERREEIARTVEEACGQLALKAVRSDVSVNYDEKKGALVYEMDGNTVYCPVEKELSHHWSAATPMYDARDTSLWTLEALNEYIQERERGRRGRELALTLTEQEDWGKMVHQFRTGDETKGMKERIDVPLGYLSQNGLEVEYTLPRGEVWAMCGQAAALAGALTLCVALCFWLLFYHLRVERRNGEIRSFYMRMYRHDLRRQMGTAMNWLEALRRRTKDRLTEEEGKMADEGTEALEEVTAGIERMIAVQVCEHGLRGHYEDVDMHALLEELTDKEKWGLTGGKEVEFATDFRADNPVVRGDRELLESLFLNLVGNALKYSRERVAVRLSTRELEGGRMEVTVEDNGLGVPPEMRERVFERGYRLERDKERRTGKGWGLYMARRIAEAHKGSIRLEDAAGGGSRFTVVLRHKRKRIWG